MKNFKFMTVVLSFMLALSAIAFGQNTTGTIEGVITDQNGAVVPGVSVTVKSTGTTAGYNNTTTTNEQGYFVFNQIPVGTYQVTTSSPTFKTVSDEVTVVLDKNANFSPKLEPGSPTVVVDVITDSSVTIDQSDTKIDTNITKQIIDDLPSGTQFTSLLKIAPNVRPEALSGGFQIDGASGSENVFVIDGQEVTNFRTGVLNTNNNLPFELLQEVQIKSTGFEAEYGGATGGVINVVTIGGNDAWRGNFGISFRTARLQGNPRPVLNRFASTAGSFEYFQPPKDGGTDFFPVANISGPIIKEKVWFSVAYTPLIFDTVRTIDYFSTGANPTNRAVSQTVQYKQNLKQEQAFARLDAQPTSKLRLFGSFLYNPLVQDGALPASTEGLGGAPQSVNFGAPIGTLTGSDLLRLQGGRQNANAVNGQVTFNPTNYLVLNFRGGRSFLNEKLNSYFIPRATRFVCSTSNAGIPAGAGCSSGFQNIANNFQINYDVSTRTTFDVDASLIGINAGGRHNFKFGYQYNKLFNTVDQGYANFGIVTLNYGIPISSQGVPITPTAGNLGSGRVQRFGTIGEASSKNQALFAQDSWQVMNRLTLNLGVRIEKETVPNFGDTANTQAIEFNWFDKISPRIGVAFDLTGDGKTKLFASYGWFYDRFKYELPRGSFGGDFFRRDYFEILPSRGVLYTNYNLAAIIGTNPDPIGGTCPIPASTGFSVCQFDFRIATNLEGADIFDSGGVDPDIKAARQSEYTIGLERQLWNNFLLSARYTHKQVDRAVEDVGVFNDQGSEAYIIGNPGFGLVCEVADSSGFPCPKAIRKYDAVEVRVDKRANRYFFNASYTFSRLFGNYSGLASSDEAGRTSPNVNRFFDLPPMAFLASGESNEGRLATDRPHVFKAYGGYSFDWRGDNVNRTTISAFTTIQSGTPLTTIYDLYQLGTTILYGRGDLGRTEMFTETDLSINHRYKFGRDNRFTIEGFIDLRNLFDEENQLTVQNLISSTIFTGGGATSPLRVGGCATCTSELAVFDTIFNGGGITQFVNNFLTAQGVSSTGRRNDYGLTNSFQAPREVRFGFRFFF
jgi:Carboxypeptidase regulatory-like domain/TonB dependent receptor-like, beta-barrel/TonB-dependent Receptor Plug Domain